VIEMFAPKKGLIIKKSRWLAIEDNGKNAKELITTIEKKNGAEIVRSHGVVYVRIPEYHRRASHTFGRFIKNVKREREDATRKINQERIKQYCAVILKGD